MFAELVELGKRVYNGHDALGTEKCSWDIVIDSEGNFKQLISCDIMIEAEKLGCCLISLKKLCWDTIHL